MKNVRLLIRLFKSVIFFLRVSIFNRYQGDLDFLIVIENKEHLLYWLVGDPGLKDRVLFNEITSQGGTVSVVFNPRDLMRFQAKIAVFINPHHFMFSKNRREHNYLQRLHAYVDELSSVAPQCYPSSDDIKFWENKVYMHEVMDAVDLRHPKTTICHDGSYPDEIEFPVIVKTEDGYSSNGLFLCQAKEDFIRAMSEVNGSFLIQEFLNIGFDIRVICVEGKVVSFYWRINDKSDDWQPTATQNGATVQFVDLPDVVFELASEIYTKTGCVTYGADICFRDDDINTTPYLLEFSPIYQPNPAPPNQLVTANYASFKGASLQYDKRFEALNRLIYSQLLVRSRRQHRIG